MAVPRELVGGGCPARQAECATPLELPIQGRAGDLLQTCRVILRNWTYQLEPWLDFSRSHTPQPCCRGAWSSPQHIELVVDDRCLRSTLPKRFSGVYYNVA